MRVIKRDGRTVEFNAERIRKAISAARDAFKHDDIFLIDHCTGEVACQCYDGISVEEIQDLVEKELIAYGAKDVAKAYHDYRVERTKARNAKSDSIIASIVAAEKNDITRENANMNADTPAGMMMKISSEASKAYVDNHLLSEEALRYVNDNLIHIHDKDYYPTRSLTCVQSPIDKILEGGFRAGHGESRPAKRIETASILACISLEQTQNEQHGGQSIPAFDFYMAPYVRLTYIEELEKIERLLHIDLSNLYDAEIKDYLLSSETPNEESLYKQFAIDQTVHRVHQSMEALVHNLNEIHSRGGNQVVFSSLNYGTDTSAEGRCVIRELLKATYRGVGNGSTAIFPIQILKIKHGVNKKPGDPNYDLYQLALKVTAKRFFPNFLNLDATFNKSEEWVADDPRRFEHEVATMGCVDGQEVITYKKGEEVFVVPFSVFWRDMSKQFDVQDAKSEGYDYGEFIDLSGIQIQDKDGFVECLRVIKNPDKGDWMKVTLSNGRVLTVTSDHPWSIEGRGVVLTKNLQLGDVVEVAPSQSAGLSLSNKSEVAKIEFIGHRDKPSYDVTTASEHFMVSGIRSHNCRTRVFENRNGKTTSIGRGNLSFTTMNLPGIALSVMGIKDEVKRNLAFFSKLKDTIDVAARQLLDRYRFQCEATAKQFPLLMSGLWVGSENLKPDDSVAEVLKQGTLGIGFIGLAECLIALIGKHHGESPVAQELGLSIVGFIKKEVDILAREHQLNFSVLATPAEGLSGKFTRKDRLKYGVVPGVTDKDYYTNSNHVPVYYKCSARHKAQIEGPYHRLTKGGHIFYVELDGDATHNTQAIDDIVKLMDKHNIGYASVNHNRNRCMDCGYEDAEKDLSECPVCHGHNIDNIQRITGYLVGTTDRWNAGKIAELKDRVTHGA